MGVTWSLDLRPALVSTGNLFVPAAALNWRALHYFIPHLPSPDRLRRSCWRHWISTASTAHRQPASYTPIAASSARLPSSPLAGATTRCAFRR
jgi:hypothetical protein